jgi:hypothetical protein
MDQRSDRLNDEDWIEDRSTLSRGDEGMLVSETVAFVELDSADAETERIKADIEDTRAEMGQTLNEIQERLSPEHVMDQVKETVREATIGKVEKVMERVNEKISSVTEPAMDAMGRAGEKIMETGSSLTNTVRRNPIPFALVGLGVGMLIVNRVRNADGRTMRSRSYGSSEDEMGYGMATPRYAGMGRQYAASGEYAGKSRQYSGGAIKQMKNTASGMMHGASDLVHGTTETVSNLGQQAKEGALRAGRGLQRLMNENPLAVGAAAVAAGAAVGLVLPRTRLEHEYMGEASERIVDKAQQVARDAMDKVKSATQGEAGGPGQQQGQQSQGQQSQGQQSKPAQPPQPGLQSQQQGQQTQQARTGQSEGGQSQSGQGQPGQTMRPGQGTPTA